MTPERWHAGQPRERGINALQQIYTIVVGLGLTGAVRTLVEPVVGASSRGLPAVVPENAYLFIALVVTLVPFYHGAVRHLDDAYIYHPAQTPPKRFAILIEFLLLFVEGILFVALGEMIASPPQFYLVILVLIAVDVVWALLSLLAATSPAVSVKKWAGINAVAFLCVFLITRELSLSDADRPLLLMVCLILRSAVDYILNIDFYLGRRDAASAV